jgi:hypothetical protein
MCFKANTQCAIELFSLGHITQVEGLKLVDYPERSFYIPGEKEDNAVQGVP